MSYILLLLCHWARFSFIWECIGQCYAIEARVQLKVDLNLFEHQLLF